MKRVLVTGAGKRIGAAIARRFGNEAAQVAVHYNRSADGAMETKASIEKAGGKAFLVQADLSDTTQVTSLVDKVLDEMGGLDVLVPSAANYQQISFDSVDLESWDTAINLNLRAPVFLAHGFRDALRDSNGCVVFITGIGASRPHKDYLPYLISKGGLKHAMKTLAIEFAPDVRVNAIAPGAVLLPETWTEQEREDILKTIPMKKTGRPSDIAEAVWHISNAPFVTGQEWRVDGGASL